MEKKCFCNTPEAGPAGNVSFRLGRFNCVAFKRGDQCIKCVQEYYSNLFQKYKFEIFKNSTHFGEVVDWEYFINCEKNHNEWGSTFPEVSDLLATLGFLSHSGQGNWEIVDHGGLNLNPSPFCNPIYFTQKRDILVYAKLKYGKTEYPWQVRHMGEVISKETVLEIA